MSYHIVSIDAPECSLSCKDGQLSCDFGITLGMWMNLQLDDEFVRADREKGEAIRKEVRKITKLNA